MSLRTWKVSWSQLEPGKTTTPNLNLLNNLPGEFLDYGICQNPIGEFRDNLFYLFIGKVFDFDLEYFALPDILHEIVIHRQESIPDGLTLWV